MKEKSKRELMNSLVRICLAFFFASVGTASAQDFQQNVVPCRSADGVMGYETIAGMNEDMMRELALLAGGKQPESSYRLVLCPNTVFDASNATLTPLLNNVMFLCGENGSRDNGCEFRGGTAQVAIEDSIIGAHKVNTVNFMGLTFTGFTGTSIGGGGSSNVTVNLDMVEFASFDSMFVVQQQNPSTQPFNLNIQDSRIRDGNGGAAFSNAGGVLSLMNVEILDTMLMAAVSTSSAGGVTGMTMVSGTTIASSSIMDIFATMEGAQISATRITVMSMQDMTNIFDVTGMGSMALLDNVTIANNDLSSVSPPPRWVGVNVRDNAMASVTGMSVSASSNIRHVISAQVNAMIDVENFIASDIIGGRQVNSGDPSGVFYADIGSDLMVSTAEVTNPSFFTSVLFAGGGSIVELTRSCLIAPSETQAPVYISENATHSGSLNYIDPAFSSSQCAEEGMRLAKEDPGSSCFEGNGVPCTVTCMPFFDAEICMRTEILTEAPSLAPTVNETLTPTSNATLAPTLTPTLSPTLAPTGNATLVPTLAPTPAVSVNETLAPTPAVSVNETFAPTSVNETEAPTAAPSTGLTLPPTQVEGVPTVMPSNVSSKMPSSIPSIAPSSIFPSASPNPSPTIAVAPSVAPSKSPTPAPSKSPTRSPTASPTRSPITPRPPVVPTPSLPPMTAPPIVDDCIKFGKWVKRKYHIKGKGYQSYYVFDENACAIYRSDDWLMGHNLDLPAQYKAFGQADQGKGGKGSERSGKGSNKGSGKGSSSDVHVPRRKRPPASIWRREESQHLRRASHD